MTILLHSLDESALERWAEALDGREPLVRSSSLSTLTERLLSGDATTAYVDLAHLPGGVETLQRLSRQFSAVRTVAMTVAPEPREGLALLRAGVLGYCSRLIEPALLTVVHRAVEVGEIWAGRAVVRHLLERDTPPRGGVDESADEAVFPALTEREREISDLVADGLSNKLIAVRLGISERTVKAHLNAVFRKTGLSSRTQLALAVQAAPLGACGSSRYG